MVAQDIDEYISLQSRNNQSALKKLREIILATIPELEQTISYKMPVFKYRRRPLAGLAAFKDHCSYFPFSPAVLQVLKGDLQAYETAKGTIHFPAHQPLPAALVRKLIEARRVEIDKAVAKK